MGKTWLINKMMDFGNHTILVRHLLILINVLE